MRSSLSRDAPYEDVASLIGSVVGKESERAARSSTAARQDVLLRRRVHRRGSGIGQEAGMALPLDTNRSSGRRPGSPALHRSCHLRMEGAKRRPRACEGRFYTSTSPRSGWTRGDGDALRGHAFGQAEPQVTTDASAPPPRARRRSYVVARRRARFLLYPRLRRPSLFPTAEFARGFKRALGPN